MMLFTCFLLLDDALLGQHRQNHLLRVYSKSKFEIKGGLPQQLHFGLCSLSIFEALNASFKGICSFSSLSFLL